MKQEGFEATRVYIAMRIVKTAASLAVWLDEPTLLSWVVLSNPASIALPGLLGGPTIPADSHEKSVKMAPRNGTPLC